MSLVSRVKNILTTPKTEWPVVDGENDSHIKVLTTYVLILAAIPAIAMFICYGLIGWHGYALTGYAIRQAIIQYVTMVGGVYLTAFVINILTENFGSRKDFDKAFSLVAYAYTPAFVGGIFYLHSSIAILASIASLYSLYLLYMGLTPMMKTPEDKRVSYFVISLIVMVVVSLVLGAILAVLIIGSTYATFGRI
jgi:hypothetical protein